MRSKTDILLNLRNLILILVLTFGKASGQGILLDENFSDWSVVPILLTDRDGDGNASGIDFRELRMANDEDRIFLNFDLGAEINLDEDNQVTLYLDADNNKLTGLNRYGIGAELVFNFGQRKGVVYAANGSSYNVFHHHVGLNISPTVSGSKYELSLNNTWKFSFQTLKIQPQIRILIVDESIAGDRIPDTDGGIQYNMDQNTKFNRSDFFIKKASDSYIRVLSYNVLRDNLFESDLGASFGRIFKAIEPDIIGFCEIYDYSGAETALKMESFLPSVNGKAWYYGSVDPDIRLVSRFPVIASMSLDGNGAFLINVRGTPFICIVAHLPCCSNDVGRQREVDKIMAFVRSVKYGISPFQVPQNTPIIIMGDMNLVGLQEQQQTLTTGDIKNNSEFGPDEFPDWDDTPLDDALPVTTNLPATFTWYNDGSSYGPGRLDYILFSGSVLEKVNQFSLWTPTLTAAQLTSSGLQEDDVPKVSDHLPLVCDFSIPGTSGTVQNETGQDMVLVFQRGEDIIVRCRAYGEIAVFDLDGRKLLTKQITSDFLPAEIVLESFRRPGLYVISFIADGKVYTKTFYKS